MESPTPQFGFDGQTLLSHLSYSHFVELLMIDYPAKRAFFVGECIRGHWSVRELKRQIASLLYERSGLPTEEVRNGRQ